MKFSSAGFRHHIDYRTAGPAGFGRSRIRRHSELLNNFIRELVRGPVPATRLAEERVVVVAAIDQIAGLKATNAAE